MNTSPQSPSQTTVPSPVITTPTTATIVPTPAVTAYPGALAPGQYATFGSEGRQGKATVYKYEIRQNYNWTAPTFSSPGSSSAARPNEVQRGYTTQKPKAGNTFLFIYVSLVNTGTSALYAPSASQFVVSSNGTFYNYTSVQGSDVVIDTVPGTQYDYQIGRGGLVGYIQPGGSNKADGYLIYEVPAAISLNDTYVLVNLDYQNRAVWRLG
ncbi:MAG: DUF4352 domain-containing protein [Methanoregulaceae archaeon]|nr:DUF4352 domain-containing protein [Methanoregulaceae archaeon]